MLSVICLLSASVVFIVLILLAAVGISVVAMMLGSVEVNSYGGSFLSVPKQVSADMYIRKEKRGGKALEHE